MRRTVFFAGLMLLVAIVGSVRIRRHKLEWGGYWSIEFSGPWNRHLR